MAEEEVTTTLAELTRAGTISLSDGYRTKKSEHGPGLPILRVAEVGSGVITPSLKDSVREEFRPKMSGKTSRPGDVLITTKGTVGRVARVPDGFHEHVYSPQLCFLRAEDSAAVDPYWLYSWARSTECQAQIRARSGQTDMAPYVSLSDLKDVQVKLPGITQQRAIADCVRPFDDLIDINGAVMRSLRAQLSALFAETMSRCHSQRVPLLEALAVEFGGAFRGGSFAEPGIGMPLLRIRDLKTFTSDVWTIERIPGDVVVTPGDVVIGMDAEFRSTYWLGQPSLLNQRVCRVSMEPPGSLAFAREALVEPLAAIERSKTGTTVIHLNKSDLERAHVSLPDKTTVARFSAVAEPLRQSLVALSDEIRDLSTTRDELLPLLMSGRVLPGEVAS